MKLKNKWNKLKTWQKGGVIGLCIGLSLPFIFLLVMIILHPSELYNEGSFQCTTWEHPSTPCPFTQAVGYLMGTLLIYEYLLGLPLLVVGTIAGVLIGLIVGIIQKR